MEEDSRQLSLFDMDGYDTCRDNQREEKLEKAGNLKRYGFLAILKTIPLAFMFIWNELRLYYYTPPCIDVIFLADRVNAL